MRAALIPWGRLTRREHTTVPLHERHRVGPVLAGSARPGIVHGGGRSYGDQALNAGGTAWLSRGLDRFIAFDAARGTLRCESGVTFQALIDLVLPRGWFVPVTPGTQFLTVGGAVANDVHGKNHHRFGTFGEHVLGLTLQRTDGQVIECGPHLNAEWFRATVGGMGLTGVITDVVLQLRRVAGPWLDTHTRIFETLDEFFAMSAARELDSEYTVAWIDCLAAGANQVRGVFFSGSHADAAETLPPVRSISVARLPEFAWVRPVTTRVFNAGYFRRMAARQGPARQSYRSFFYPLDALRDWNRLYGRPGFYQYQCVVPESTQRDAVAELLRAVAASGSASFLNVLKTFGARPSLGLMSFPLPGTTLALDFPNRGASTLRLFERLNAIVASAGGRLYPAKDAAMPAALFRQGYPRLDEFLPYRDPGLSSEMSRRLLGH